MIPQDLKYTNTHEWVRVLEDNVVVVGITDFAQDQLGDIVFVEVPQVGISYEQGKPMGTVESVKTVSDMYAPVSGEVIEVNACLCESNDEFSPEIVNQDAFGQGWIARIKMSNVAELDKLLDAADYKQITEKV
ncbi:MAG: glycine cleavage system protein GcvH [Candidatus Bruticola sp.]